jgi:hypothetical protein
LPNNTGEVCLDTDRSAEIGVVAVAELAEPHASPKALARIAWRAMLGAIVLELSAIHEFRVGGLMP